jgi:hypothetical protein
MSKSVSITLEVWIDDEKRTLLHKLAATADDEALGAHVDTYSDADAFALAFNTANLAPDAIGCLTGWSAIPEGGFTGEPPA